MGEFARPTNVDPTQIATVQVLNHATLILTNVMMLLAHLVSVHLNHEQESLMPI